MATGWKNPDSRPEGRKAFADSPTVVRPGEYGDGSPRMGTPAGAEHHTVTRYLDKAGRAYRAAHRGDEQTPENGTKEHK